MSSSAKNAGKKCGNAMRDFPHDCGMVEESYLDKQSENESKVCEIRQLNNVPLNLGSLPPNQENFSTCMYTKVPLGTKHTNIAFGKHHTTGTW